MINLFPTKISRTVKHLFSVKWPKSVDFSRPEDQGLEGARNFYLETDPGIVVGIWHILPRSLVEESYEKTGLVTPS